jgi:prepilin-type N-terminal cleavage/methylation domain-containing protein
MKTPLQIPRRRAADALRTTPSCRGFSIWELVSAIVILGIVFAMALKGSVLVESMRAFLTAYQLERFQHAVMSYRETFNTLPGDDGFGHRRWGRPQAIMLFAGAPVTFSNDERINGRLFDLLNPNGENFLAWADLRGFGAVEGDVNLVGFSAMPENLFGGVFGFDEGNLGQSSSSICATRIPGRAAEIIDRRMDDGAINSGKVVATSRYDTAALNHFDAPDSQPYNIEKEYIICVPAVP